uniref:Uncharacterized protein n=1 Tax=Chenopodium quinoa TaxID=63459 RepID=A0A803MJC9_CHEQI
MQHTVLVENYFKGFERYLYWNLTPVAVRIHEKVQAFWMLEMADGISLTCFAPILTPPLPTQFLNHNNQYRVLGHRSGYARGLGKAHPVSSKDGKIGRAELEQNIEKLQNENNMMRAELEASKKKQEDLEQKLRLVMEKIGLDA